MANNIRSVLEYVPCFQGRLFVLHIASSLLQSEELVDALLDADALHELGVRLILIAEGNDASALVHRAAVCEIHAAEAELPLTAGQPALDRVREIIERRQVAIVASGVSGRFDEGSIALSVSAGAAKYICLQVDPVPSRKGSPVFAIAESEVDASCACDDAAQTKELQAAACVCRRGIPRVHLLDGRRRGVLLDEIFSEEGVGSMVHTDSYREIRPLREEDIPELLSMIARCVVDEKLVQRTYESIHSEMESYYVYTLDDTIVGCVALYPYPDYSCAELGCLFIRRDYEGHGYGRALCRFVEDKARRLGFRSIFAISQSAVDYFRNRLHYATLPRSVLPPQRLAVLESSGRRSEVFGREL